MAKLSRMKKYEAYRNQIQYGNEDSLASDDLTDFTDRLNRIDRSLTQDVSSKPLSRSNGQASRMRTYDSVDQARGTIGQTSNENKAKNESFKNEYLDEFLDEVKKYNVEQGYADNEDTQLNIIASLKPKSKITNQTNNAPKIKSYQNGNALYEDKAQGDGTNSNGSSNEDGVMDEKQLAAVQASVLDKRNSITQELQNLLNDDSPIESTDSTTTEKAASQDSEPEITPLRNGKRNSTNTTFDMSKNSVQRQKDLLEKTAQQAVKLAQQYDAMDENIDDIEDKVGHNTRLVNFILILIVIALVVILVVIIYAILLMKGVI